MGVTPKGLQAPMVLPITCLGRGRGPKALARWEHRQAERQALTAWRGSSSCGGGPFHNITVLKAAQ